MTLKPEIRQARPTGLRRAADATLWLLLAIAIGLGSAWFVIRGVSRHGESIGPWRASALAGAPDADPWTRARVAVGGLLALHREQAMYYIAASDSTGAPLRSRCSYRVSGKPPSGRWWSVTAYADDLFLFDHPERRYSMDGRQARLDDQGRFSFVVGGANRQDQSDDEPWLPTPGDRGLVLTLRVYYPERALIAAPASLEAPRVDRLGACK